MPQRDPSAAAMQNKKSPPEGRLFNIKTHGILFPFSRIANADTRDSRIANSGKRDVLNLFNPFCFCHHGKNHSFRGSGYRPEKDFP